MPLIADPDQPAWLVKANCALPPRQTAWACFAPCLVAMGPAAAWWYASGHWGFFAFALLQAAGMAAAFLAYSHHVGDHETVRLHDGLIEIEQWHGLAVRRSRFACARVRLLQDTQAGSPLLVQAPGRSVQLGRLLSGPERHALAQALSQALALRR